MTRVKYWTVIIFMVMMVYLMIIRPQQKYYDAHHVNINGTYLINALEIKDFAFNDTEGKFFDNNRLKNHWTLLYFGFTHCEMVCPVTLSVLNKAYHLLQQQLPLQNLPQVVFVSIDSKQDDVTRLKNYINNINSHFLGAVMEADQIALMQKVFHIIIRPITLNNKQTFDHSPEILLINPEAKIKALFSYPSTPQQLTKDYLAIVQKEK